MRAKFDSDLEIVGIVNHVPGAVGDPPSATDFDPAYIREVALVQEAAGYDRVLIANSARMPESFILGAYLANVTKSLGFMLAHRPGPMMPTMAARHLATLDRLSGGRAAVHVIAGADDREVQADGAFTTKEERYLIAAEYVEVMRKMWSSAEPFDFDGDFYKFRGANAMVRPSSGDISVHWGGSSDLSLDLCGKVANVYAMAGDTFEHAGGLSRKAHAAASRHGREIKVMMTVVIICEETEDAAWERANQVYQRATEQVERGARGIVMGKHDKDDEKAAAGAFQRLLEQSREGDRLDRCLWTGLNKVYKGRGNNSVLVGTPQQIADSLMEYRSYGITRFLLRGPDQINDAAFIGAGLVPELRRLMSEKEHSEGSVKRDASEIS